MPCYDLVDETRTENAFLTAALCATLHRLEIMYGARHNQEHMLGDLIFEDAGISKEELMSWWAKHRVIDQARRAAVLLQRAEDKKAKRIEVVRTRARNKLTVEELQALGLTP